MNQTFSTRTMWQSFVCALVATFTLAVSDGPLCEPVQADDSVYGPLSYRQTRLVPGIIRSGLALLRDSCLHPNWPVRSKLARDNLSQAYMQGLYGAFVIKFNLQMAAFRRKNLAQHGVAEAVILATLTAMVGYLNRFLRIDMTESMALLFRECEGGGDHNGLCQ